MAAPLFLIAALWDHFDLGRRPWLRGRKLSIGPLRVHTTNLVSGLMFVLLGAVFIAYEGTSTFSGLYEENGAVDVAYDAEQWTRSLANSVPNALVLAAVLAAALLLAVAAYRRRRRKVRDVANNGDDKAARRKSLDRAKR